MIRHIQTEHVRAHQLDDRAVSCPNARDYDRQSPYGVKAKTGMWITFKEGDDRIRSGRVLGRVTAEPIAPDPPMECYVSVLCLSDHMTHAYIRWVDPADVLEVSAQAPAKLLAWISGPMPTADLVHKLSAYGTLSESYVDKVDHHINAWEHGVSPAAWDAGVRKGGE